MPVLILLLLDTALSSRKCQGGNGGGGGGTSTTTMTLYLTATWSTAGIPSSNTCFGFPAIGNNPRFDAGSCSAYDPAYRFTEVIVTNRNTQQEVSRKCWSNNTGAAANSMDISVPTDVPFKVTFSQTDNCNSCMRVFVGSSGLRNTRMKWEKILFYDRPAGSINVTPAYITYSICQ